MKRRFLPVFIVCLTIYVFGCGRKKSADDYEVISIEEISAIETLPAQSLPRQEIASSGLEPLPPGGPYRPTVSEIQSALKNAGFYTGPIDGKNGPLTRKATEEFQEAQGLKADGKVGPKTWSALSGHLSLEDE